MFVSELHEMLIVNPLTKCVFLHLPLSEYNPRYFEDPYEFKPSRWYGVPDGSELFAGFSIGMHDLYPALLMSNIGLTSSRWYRTSRLHRSEI